MRKRYLLLAVLVTFLLSNASAAVYGTFPYDQEQRSDELSTELRLGVVNTGDRKLDLEFSVPDSEVYNVSLPGEAELPPSDVVRDPEGEGWKYLGNGKYAEIQIYTFPVEISRYRDSNSVDIPLQVTASPSRGSGDGSSASIVQQTTHRYTVLLDPTLVPLDRETRMEKEVRWEDEDGESLPEDWRDEEESSSEEYKSNQSEQGTGEREQSGVNTVTMILVVAIAACSLYLARVI